MLKINTYTASGIKSYTNLPKVFQEKVNENLLAQAIRIYQDRSHPGLSKVKTRSEISLTTAKVWRQKGTGRARHGARSAPIFVGGGVAHGPKGVKRNLKLSKKITKKSLIMALSFKAREGKIVIVCNFTKIIKTKEAQKFIDTLVAKENLKKGVKISLILSEENKETGKAFENIKYITILAPRSLNAMNVFLGGLLVFDKKAFESLIKFEDSSGRKGVSGGIKKNEKVSNRKKRNAGNAIVSKSVEKGKK